MNWLDAALCGQRVVVDLYESIDDYRVAMIDLVGLQIELIPTGLADAARFGRARAGSLYRPPA